MRELHISIVYHPSPEAILGTLRDLHLSRRPNANQNCIICKVAEDVSDDVAMEKVKQYFVKERGRKPHEFSLRLGHNEHKEVPHREGEPELTITTNGVVLSRPVAA